jgi:hypothetical protein
MLSLFPFIGSSKTKVSNELGLEIPLAARQRITEVVQKGGVITNLSYYIPDKSGRYSGGTLFFTTPEERAWIRK